MPETASIRIYNALGNEITDNGWQGGQGTQYEVPMLEIEKAGYFATAYNREDNLVSMSWNNINGDFCDRLIAYKEKLIIKFDCISGEYVNKLLYGPNGIYTIIMKEKHRFFHVVVNQNKISSAIDNTYIDPNNTHLDTNGNIYYLGTPTKLERLGGATNKRTITVGQETKTVGLDEMFSIELHFIQARSHRINPFTSNTPSSNDSSSEST